ncbi:prolyl oligopeptidase family serine peptidase [Bacteroides thetaiotaomicron]|uniref:alpha/beta hydrolase n=1 Tax=Bacteroides thetaiotaomicron TaxID=818 RepID=UPI0021FD97E8|nr:prolyl oligopeptidase family serine peptidase [Bacteroides thetaiotaomicron]
MILFNPVIDNGPHGYGFDRVKDYYRDFSPIHNIKKDAPPAIFFLGSEDNIVLLETALKFKKKMEHVGSRCDLLLYPGQKHGFFNAKFEEFFEKTMSATVVFLKSLGYIK